LSYCATRFAGGVGRYKEFNAVKCVFMRAGFSRKSKSYRTRVNWIGYCSQVAPGHYELMATRMAGGVGRYKEFNAVKCVFMRAGFSINSKSYRTRVNWIGYCSMVAHVHYELFGDEIGMCS